MWSRTIVALQCSTIPRQQRIAQPGGNFEGASVTLVPQSSASFLFVRIDGHCGHDASYPRLDPLELSRTGFMSSAPAFFDDTIFSYIHGTPDMSHGSQPAFEPPMKVNDQLHAFPVIQPSTKRMRQSSGLVAITSTNPHLGWMYRHRVIPRIAAVINFTVLKAYLGGTATYDKKMPQNFGVLNTTLHQPLPSTLCARCAPNDATPAHLNQAILQLCGLPTHKELGEHTAHTTSPPLCQAVERKPVVA